MNSMEDTILQANNAWFKGDWSQSLGIYSFPLAVYVGQYVLILNSEEELTSQIDVFKMSVTRMGVTEVKTARIPSIHTGSAHRTLLLQTLYYDANGDVLDSGISRNFYSVRAGRPLVQMVEFTKVAFKDVLLEQAFFHAA